VRKNGTEWQNFKWNMQRTFGGIAWNTLRLQKEKRVA